MFIFYVDLEQNGSNYPVKCESFANSQSFDGMVELHFVEGVTDGAYPDEKVKLICLKKSQVNYFYMLDKKEDVEIPEELDIFEEESSEEYVEEQPQQSKKKYRTR